MLSLTLADGTTLQGLRAGDPARCTGVHLLLVHGLGEHIGRYAAFIERLVAAGHAVTAFDQRGHGRSPGPRGGIPREDSLLVDLGAMIDAARPAGDRPLLLLGHSLGGTVTARFVAEGLQPHPAAWYRPVDGLVLSSPALAVDLNPLQHLLLILGRLASTNPAGNGLKPAWISRDAQVVRDYVQDPLVHDRITPRMARFMLDSGARVRAVAPRWTVPTLLLWAGADRCVAPRGSAAFASAAPAACVRAQVFESLYHEIFNEPERDAVIAVLISWLAARAAA